jgi:predicted transposase YdaD
MGEADKPHDAFFKSLLEVPGVAQALLRERLPPEVVRVLADEPPEERPGSFIDADLRASQSDKLFVARTRGGRPAYVYCLVEHKSTPDRDVALQLLRYQTRIWERDAAEGQPLLPIFALVVYNGRTRWRIPARFSALFDVEAALLPLLLDFPFGVLDLGAVDDLKLGEEPSLRGGLLGLKYGTRTEAQVRMLTTVLRGYLGPDGLPRPALVSYVIRAWRSIRKERVLEALSEVAPGREAEMTAYEEFVEEGRVKGQAEGRASVTAVLRGVLAARFPPITAELERRLEVADLSTLQRWAIAALTAPSVEAALSDD